MRVPLRLSGEPPCRQDLLLRHKDEIDRSIREDAAVAEAFGRMSYSSSRACSMVLCDGFRIESRQVGLERGGRGKY